MNSWIAFAILACVLLAVWLMYKSKWQSFDDGKDEPAAGQTTDDLQSPDNWWV